MNTNSNGFPSQSQGQQQYSQAHINNAMLAALQNQQNTQFQQKAFNNASFNPQMFQQHGLNPNQPMNGRSNGPPQQQTLNPAMLLQQAHGGSGGQGGLVHGMNGVNSSALGMNSGSGGQGNTGMNSMNANMMGFTPQQLAQLQAMTPQQLTQMKMAMQQQQQHGMQPQHQQRQFNQNQQFAQSQQSPQFPPSQQQFNNAIQQPAQQQQQGLQAVLAQQQAQQSMGAFYDRPSSTSSATHSQQGQQFPQQQQSPHGQQFPLQSSSQFQMMPPPPPRPPSSRPGTSNSHTSHHSSQQMAIPAPQSPSLGQPMQRPPSRPRTSSGFSPFGPQGQGMQKPPTPIQPAPPLAQVHTPTQASSPFPQQHGPGHGQPFPQVPTTPVPGSPGRKRKLTGPNGVELQPSPQFNSMGGGLAGPSMGNGAGALMSAMSPGGMIANAPSPGSSLRGGAGGGMMGPPHVVPSRATSIGAQPHPSDAPPLMGVQSPLHPQVPPTPTMNAAFPSGVQHPGMDVRVRQASVGASGFPDQHPAMHSPVVQQKLPAVVSALTSQRHMSAAAASPARSATFPALPASGGLNPKTTRVTLVSPEDVAPLTDQEVEQLKVWQERDKEYDGLYRVMKERMADEIKELRASHGSMWWESSDGRKLRTKFGVTYPGQRARESRKRGRREGFKLPSKVDPEDTDRPELLVPIRLEFDVEHHKMRDTFVWNLNDAVITPEIFAQSVVDDYSLAPSYVSVITKQIQDQLSDFKAHSAALGEDELEADAQGPMKGRLDAEDQLWWEGWRKRVEADSIAASRKERHSRKRRKVDAQKTPAVKAQPYGSDVGFDKVMLPVNVVDIEVDENDMLEEMRILIRLDIVVGSMKLDDQFEWDIDNPGASPEQFAEVYAKELGLGGEFKTAIAHSIREQVQTYQKSLFLVGHPSDGTMVQDDDLRMSFLPSVSSAARAMDQVQAFTPILNYLSDSELERNEKEREKELNRRRKRNTRGRRGIALPDREPTKTFRTPAIGFPDVDPATLALAQAAAAPTSRRAAAAAASLTIANMVASENGTAVVTPTLPTAPVPAPATPKEKKSRGLFKAPSYPSSVLRPRAHVTAPTPSTAADASLLPPPLENDPPAAVPTAPPDSRITKTISAKRAKELEREAKEKEFADGQHANMINGVWHCSNCGCPEDIAIGRRKGPLGDKSQCGTCGKYWHRHRRPLPVVYNSDPEFHLNLKLESERSRAYAKKKGGAALLRAAQTPAVDQEATTPVPFVEPETPTRSKAEVWVGVPGRTPERGRPHADDERAVSPVSSGSSSASEPIMAQKMKMNGVHHTKSESDLQAPHAPSEPNPGSAGSPPNAGSSSAPPQADAPASSQPAQDLPPEWLTEATAAARLEYPNDRFEVISRNGPTGEREWRMRCLDCPGKMYKPGEQSLSNFEVHLKNRMHRQKVNDRMKNEGLGPARPS